VPQIKRFAPAELMMLDRDESALHAVQLRCTGARAGRPDLILADLRDAETIRKILADRRPQVDFPRGRARSTVTLLETHPGEA
jgi:FlaA1/EpsC-like NDP-sugar epimerase